MRKWNVRKRQRSQIGKDELVWEKMILRGYRELNLTTKTDGKSVQPPFAVKSVCLVLITVTMTTQPAKKKVKRGRARGTNV